MKKKLIWLILLSLITLFPLTSVKALTKVKFDETANGNINTSINFEEGFVGGIDLVFQVSNSVGVKSFEFNKEYVKNDYTTDYKYDANKHTLTIKITTGGIGAEHNILNSKKELNLGKIIFETSSSKNVEYSLSILSLKYLDNTWKSETVNDGHLTIDGNSKFTYKVVANTETGDNKEENNSGNSSTNSTVSSGETTSSGNGNKNNQKNEVGNSTTSSTSKEDKDSNTNTNSNDVDILEENQEDNSNDIIENDDNIEEKEDTKKNNNDKEQNNSLKIIITVVAGLVIVSIIMVFVLKGKKPKIDF